MIQSIENLAGINTPERNPSENNTQLHSHHNLKLKNADDNLYSNKPSMRSNNVGNKNDDYHASNN